MPPDRTQILRAYRELLGLIRRLPVDKRAKVLSEAREEMRRHQNESDHVGRSERFKRLCERISFLRVITPRGPGARSSSVVSGKFVLRNGELVQGSGRTAGSRYVRDSQSRQMHGDAGTEAWNDARFLLWIV